MREELKYCKFCDKEKPIKEFCKSGSFIKNICRECQNKKQKQIYQNSKKVEELKNQLQQKENIIKEVREYNEQIIKDTKDFYRPTEDIIYPGDSLIDIATQNLEILDKVDKGE